MAWKYSVKLKFDTLEKVKDEGKFIQDMLSYVYGAFEVIQFKSNGNTYKVIYKFIAGEQIKDPEGALLRGLNVVDKYKINIIDFKYLEISEEFPSYLEHMALKIKKGQKPLSKEEFDKKIEEGNYWRDL